VTAAVAALLLVMTEPEALARDVTLGSAFVPVMGTTRWLSPLALALLVAVLLFVARCLWAARPLLDVRSWPTLLRQVDVVAAGLLAAALAGIILAFSTADPQEQVLSPAAPWLLPASAAAAVGFWLRSRSAQERLVPEGALRATAAWGAMVVSFFVGSALVAALVDIPVFARLTVYADSQLSAALVLVRFLVGLPLGAFLGGWLTTRLPAGLVTAFGMAASTVGFGWMSQWGLESLLSPLATVPLVLAGLGIGLAMAPVNAALLAATDDAVHGVTSAALVVARTIGKLVGISALTAIGLRRYYATQGDLPSPREVCPDGSSRCPEFTLLLKEAGLTQIHTIFLGAAVCCVVAGLVALVVFRHADTRAVGRAVAEARWWAVQR
jgi:hypothetical protein